ncbi:hypothetical protein BJF93_01275 [Xaviernesmea oryzae]|uniref:BolA family transcriptional regulator n=1 Tax=Xaviernesmea oryzae TaxID=464029 RepID=A0A1Q9B261_9HYPH|nr:BolA family protein [Xaviernesmea oryzae]OLP62110.1 hypothetical protein BJF93_01275 [Xaviernesmea oryzae]
MSAKDRITARLTEAFHPERLAVLDESHLHAGHQESFDGKGETHLRIRIVAAAFAGLNRLARHRAVNELVQPEFEAGLHALAVEAAAPGEPTRW